MKRNQKTLGFSLLLIALAILLPTAIVFYLYSGGATSNSTSSPSASPTPATTTGTGPANQTSPDAQRSRPEATKPVEDRIVATQVAGTVKNERSEIVTDAIVVLFAGDRKGSEPQMVEAGQFRFTQVPLKPDVTYSLQAKAPGLCGEESFTSKSIDQNQKISKDIILKPCLTQTSGSQGNTKLEVAGLTNISEGLTGTTAVLNSMKVWTQALAILLILTIIAFLATTITFMILVQRQVAENRRRINLLWQSEFDRDSKKQQPPVEPAPMFLNIPNEVSQTLEKLLVVVTERLPLPGGQQPNNDPEPPLTGETSQQPVKTMTPAYQPPISNYLPESSEWYRTLLQGGVVSPDPLYTEIKAETSTFGSNRRISFDTRPNHGSFVILAEREETGLIFPNPRSPFVSDHHRVFEELNQNNFDQEIKNVGPKKVILQDGCWQLSYEPT